MSRKKVISEPKERRMVNMSKASWKLVDDLTEEANKYSARHITFSNIMENTIRIQARDPRERIKERMSEITDEVNNLHEELFALKNKEKLIDIQEHKQQTLVAMQKVTDSGSDI